MSHSAESGNNRNPALKYEGWVFELFANVFAKEPTVEFLRLLQRNENRALLQSYGVDPLSDIKDFPIEKQASLLAVEYARLFVLPTRVSSLYESIHKGEGRLWGESAKKLQKIYKKFGFIIDDESNTIPDHLSVELSFLAALSNLAFTYEQKGLSNARDGVLQVEKYFLKNHLLSWFFHFKNAIITHVHLAYYKEMARLLGSVLLKAQEAVKEAAEIPQ